MKCRKKPIIVEVEQWTRQNIEDDSNSSMLCEEFRKGKIEYHDVFRLRIKTLEGTMICNTGDYIIRGINGEIYPVNKDIFEKTYEILEGINVSACT